MSSSKRGEELTNRGLRENVRHSGVQRAHKDDAFLAV